MTDQSARLRAIEKQVTEISTNVIAMKEQLAYNTQIVSSMKDGSRILPQCKLHEKDIAEIKTELKAQKGFKNSLTLSAVGGAVALFVKHVWDKLIH